MPSHPSTRNKASTDEAFGSKVLSGAGVSCIQRINIDDFTISDLTQSVQGFIKLGLKEILILTGSLPTAYTLYRQLSRPELCFFFFFSRRQAYSIYSTIHTILIRTISVAVFFRSSRSLFPKDTHEIVTRQFLSLHFRVTPYARFFTVLVS